MKHLVIVLCSLVAGCGISYYPFGTLPKDFVQAASKTEFRLGAWLDTAGPYGDLWIILINDNQAWVEANTSKHKIKLTEADVTRIKMAIQESDFFSLRETIMEPLVPLHQPEFDLYVSINGRYKWVNMYDPKAVGNTEEVRRFVHLWNAVMKTLKLKPNYLSAGEQLAARDASSGPR
jgi:hypothetical protein